MRAYTSIRMLPVLGLVAAVGACDSPITSSEVFEAEEGTTLEGPSGENFTLGGVSVLTSSASDVWPELEGDFVAWYREAPADQEGLWLMDLRSGESSRVWEGTVTSAFEMFGGEIFWGSADGLHTYEIASGSLETLTTAYRDYRDVSAGSRYITGTSRDNADRPFFFDRATNAEERIPTPTAVPATRGWGDWLLYSDTRRSNSERELFLYHIPTAAETQITRLGQVLTTANSDISENRVAYYNARFCGGQIEIYDMASETTTPVTLDRNCPRVVFLDGDVLAYYQAASGGIIYLGFVDLASGEKVELELRNPGNWRIDADLDGSRVVHTSADGLTLVDLRFQEELPPVADAGGPYTVSEGTALILDGSGSYSLNEATLSYVWTLDDGRTLTGVDPAASWRDNGSFEVTLTVSEESGLSGEDRARVTVENSPPEIVMGAGAARRAGPVEGLAGVEGEPLTVQAFFSDAGLADAPWRWWVAWDLGEVASGVMEEQGALPPVTWTPPEPGSYSVTVRVEDKDGGVAEARMPLQVDEAPLPPLRIHAGGEEGHNVPAAHSSGVFPVVVFGQEEIPVDGLDMAAFRLGPAQASPLTKRGPAPSFRDHDEDGLMDLVLSFRMNEVGLTPDHSRVCLSGATVEGDVVEGCSPIRVAGGGNGKTGG